MNGLKESQWLMIDWKLYQRHETHAEMRPYEPGESLPYVSISEADRQNGSPKPGDMIARNPSNPNDQWLVSNEYFVKNFRTLPVN